MQTLRDHWREYLIEGGLGMLGAAELFVRLHGRDGVRCAKFHHPVNVPCIFVCGFLETSA
jgi:aquaporin Z